MVYTLIHIRDLPGILDELRQVHDKCTTYVHSKTRNSERFCAGFWMEYTQSMMHQKAYEGLSALG